MAIYRVVNFGKHSIEPAFVPQVCGHISAMMQAAKNHFRLRFSCTSTSLLWQAIVFNLWRCLCLKQFDFAQSLSTHIRTGLVISVSELNRKTTNYTAESNIFISRLKLLLLRMKHAGLDNLWIMHQVKIAFFSDLALSRFWLRLKEKILGTSIFRQSLPNIYDETITGVL